MLHRTVLAIRQQLTQTLPQVLPITPILHWIHPLSLSSQHRVQRYLEGVVNHSGYELAQERTRALDARVLVYFDQPDLLLCVNDVVESEYLEAMCAIGRVDLLLHSAKGHEGDLLNPLPYTVNLLNS